MNHILVAYYSRTGHTRRVAEEIARLLGARLLSIDEPRSRRGPGGYLRSAWEAMRGHEADIGAPATDPSGYDLVVLGTPVWAGHASSPVRTWARRHGQHLERVALFCTLGGSGAQRALDELERELHHTPMATLALTDRVIDRGDLRTPLTHFVDALRSRLPAEVLREAA